MIRADHPDDVVLVVGHSNTVPELVQKWSPGAVVENPLTGFDKIFVVVPRPGTTAGWSMFRYQSNGP